MLLKFHLCRAMHFSILVVVLNSVLMKVKQKERKNKQLEKKKQVNAGACNYSYETRAVDHFPTKEIRFLMGTQIVFFVPRS